MITSKKYILFDLDGTLTDPKLGICTCVQYALKLFDIDEPDLDKLEPFIGPPLKDSFMQYYGLSEEQAIAAIEKYRERFSVTGKFENEVYEGIPQLLSDLKDYGYHLAVASSKPECFVKDIMDHFRIAKYFDVIVGSELDGTRIDKAEVIHEALNQLFHYGKIRTEQVIMIGDRKFDVEGAEREAIAGTKNAILNNLSELCVSLYHRSEDIFELPLLIHEFLPEHALFIEKTPYIPAWEINLYACVRQNGKILGFRE